MDTLFWKNLSPNIEILSSSKQFYNQYYYRLNVYAPGCKSIKCENVALDIDKRKDWLRDYKRQGSLYNKQLYNHLKQAYI